ncbi:hypothetical protein NDU88_000545 [Pleurodeles waltl]|uniref:Uncharacterized protein n=1 Tax=Pleurodeles waltl TaxID=8319 RepID=A0AAV7MIC7_PLEWA|nr:hypothetical protein NDU88_000545 [Pleurodeles waltl]
MSNDSLRPNHVLSEFPPPRCALSKASDSPRLSRRDCRTVRVGTTHSRVLFPGRASRCSRRAPARHCRLVLWFSALSLPPLPRSGGFEAPPCGPRRYCTLLRSAPAGSSAPARPAAALRVISLFPVPSAALQRPLRPRRGCRGRALAVTRAPVTRCAARVRLCGASVPSPPLLLEGLRAAKTRRSQEDHRLTPSVAVRLEPFMDFWCCS